MVTRRLVAVCAALTLAVGVARTGRVRDPYGLIKPGVRVVRPAVVRARAGARTGDVRTVAVPVRKTPPASGTDRPAHADPPEVPGRAGAPGVYLARTVAETGRSSWAALARVVRGPGRRSMGGPDAAWVRVPGPYPACTWPGQAALWWYWPPAARDGRTVDGRRVKYRRTRPHLRPVSRRRRARSVAGTLRRPRHMRGEYGRIYRAVLAFRDGPACFHCGTRFADPSTEATFDHYLPSTLWRTRRHNAPWNVVLACDGCNGAKGDRLPWPLVWLLLARLGGVESAAA
ncbi:HNH endonuclease [Nonomuraea rubra]